MFAASNLGQSLFNSFMISIPATVIPVTLAAFAAYAFAWMKFPGRDWIFLALVGLLAVPLQLTFIPVTTELVKLGLTPEKLTAAGLPPFIPLWLAHAGYGLPFSIYLLSNFFRALPVTCSSRRRSMERGRSRSSSVSCCRSRCRPSRRS